MPKHYTLWCKPVRRKSTKWELALHLWRSATWIINPNSEDRERENYSDYADDCDQHQLNNCFRFPMSHGCLGAGERQPVDRILHRLAGWTRKMWKNSHVDLPNLKEWAHKIRNRFLIAVRLLESATRSVGTKFDDYRKIFFFQVYSRNLRILFICPVHQDYSEIDIPLEMSSFLLAKTRYFFCCSQRACRKFNMCHLCRNRSHIICLGKKFKKCDKWYACS